MKEGLAIGIPTYNRKAELIRMLKSIESQKFEELSEIVIGDNNSNYDIVDELQSSLSQQFLKKCRIIKNRANIGGSANIKNQFLYCEYKWFWLIGDDDEITGDSIEIVLNDIKGHPDCAYFKYSTLMDDGMLQEKDTDIYSLPDFIDYCVSQKNVNNLVFMSNNVYNMDKLSQYLPELMTYNTSVSQCVPAIVGLDRKDIYIHFSSKPICVYHMPENGVAWNMLRVMLALSCIQEIPLSSISKKYQKRLLAVFQLVPFRLLVGWCIRNKKKVPSYNLIKRVHSGIYADSVNLFNCCLLFLCKLEFQYNIPLLDKIYAIKKR